MLNPFDRSLFIFRRDLRIQDNTALNECLQKSKKILACFILDPTQVGHENKYRSNNAIQFMMESLRDLKHQLGGKLNIYYGKTISIVGQLIRKYKINAVWCNMDYTPFSRERDTKIKNETEKNNAKFFMYEDLLLNNILENPVLTLGGKFYEKFTPFLTASRKRKVKNIQRLIANTLINKCVKDNKGTITPATIKKLFKNNKNIAVHGGRQEAKRILLELQGSRTHLTGYGMQRNQMVFKTSMLSAHNKFGTVSIREVYNSIMRSKGLNNADKDILSKQLYWRDFYTYVAWFNPRILAGPIRAFDQKYHKIKWLNLKTELGKKYWLAWTQGKTGYPIVDACMNQLNISGYMHNRGRMIVSNFLVRDLGINWEHGERYFASQLVDYDPVQNNQGWQFSSSSGASAQDWFRVMNPWTQQQKFDSDANYIKKWLPDFKHVPKEAIFDWERNHKMYIFKYKLKYPEPIVNHDQARMRTLKDYRMAVSTLKK
jgi:deoxyribodipyrimidine photo-lyase